MKIKTTEAAILVASKEELILDEIRLPERLSSGQVLVEIITSGICGAQINEIDAVKGPDLFLPHLLGHEGYARVLEVGDNVSTVKEGDEVVMHWRLGSGLQANPASYSWMGKQLNAGWVTTFNRHAVVSENRVTQINGSGLSAELIPLFGCALTTSLGVLENEARVTNSDHLLILGAGGVGLTLLKIAKFMRVKEITVIDLSLDKLEAARRLGATTVIQFKNKAQVLEECSSILTSKPSIAIDTTGSPPAIEVCYESTASEARIILVGVPRIGSKVSIYTLPLHFGKQISGSKGGGSKPQTDIPKLVDLLKRKSLDFSDFPTELHHFSELNKAISNLRNGSVGRMVISF